MSLRSLAFAASIVALLSALAVHYYLPSGVSQLSADPLKTAKASVEVNAKDNSEAKPKANAEETTKATVEVTAEETAKANPKATAEETAEAEASSAEDMTETKTIYEFSAKDIDGNEVSLDKYKGYALIVVNVASNCGFTKTHYKELNELYDKYEEKGLRILAFPCNQFMGQEPGCDIDIKEFAKKQNARFDFFSKVEVNGENAHPLWKWLKEHQKGMFGNFIKWNFTKFLIDRNGVPVKRFAPTTNPSKMADELEAVISAQSG